MRHRRHEPRGRHSEEARSEGPAAQDARASLLRWYPAAWRERYGDEMSAMVEDTLGGKPPSLKLRVQLARGGAREHLHRAALIGDDHPPEDRRRAGAALVLAGWGALVIAGATFAKATEHWQDATSPAQRTIADAAYTTVEVAAGIGAVAILAAVLAALPALRRALALGGWKVIRGAVGLAVILSVAGAAATAGLAQWAHHLSYADRNGASSSYGGAFLGWGVLCVAIVAAWTNAGIRVERGLRPSARLMRIEWAAGSLAAVSTVVVSASIMTWWAAVATKSPWVLQGAAPGSSGSWWSLPVGAAVVIAVPAAGAAAYGLRRLVRPLR